MMARVKKLTDAEFSAFAATIEELANGIDRVIEDIFKGRTEPLSDLTGRALTMNRASRSLSELAHQLIVKIAMAERERSLEARYRAEDRS